MCEFYIKLFKTVCIYKNVVVTLYFVRVVGFSKET